MRSSVNTMSSIYGTSIIILDFMAQVEPEYECRALAIRPLASMKLWADPMLGSNPDEQQKDDLIAFANSLGIEAQTPYLLIPSTLYKKAYYSDFNPAIRDAHGRLFLRARIERPVIPYKLSPAGIEHLEAASTRLASSVAKWLIDNPVHYHGES